MGHAFTPLTALAVLFWSGGAGGDNQPISHFSIVVTSKKLSQSRAGGERETCCLWRLMEAVDQRHRLTAGAISAVVFVLTCF